MRFPGKRLIDGFNNWRLRKSSVSADHEPPVDNAERDGRQQPEPELHTEIVSRRVTTTGNLAAEDEILQHTESGNASPDALPDEPEAVTSEVSPIPAQPPADTTPEKKKSLSPRKPRASRPAPRPRKLKVKDEPVTDRELAALEAENTRLKRLLNERLASKENGSGS